MSTPPGPSTDPAFLARLRAATALLEELVADRALLVGVPPDDQRRLLQAAGHVYSPDAARPPPPGARHDARAQGDQGPPRGRERSTPPASAPCAASRSTPAPTSSRRRSSSSARWPTTPTSASRSSRSTATSARGSSPSIHHFYDQLCPPCAEFNYAKRTETADLTGRVALLTGGRVKIGYQAGIKLLRAGARLIVTTRFPRDSAARYAREPDFGDWGHRLEIFGLDLRHTPSVEAFCDELLATRDRLDFIVNNACQTVRRPPEFYEHMMDGERGGAPRHAGARPRSCSAAGRAGAARTCTSTARRAPPSRPPPSSAACRASPAWSTRPSCRRCRY